MLNSGIIVVTALALAAGGGFSAFMGIDRPEHELWVLTKPREGGVVPEIIVVNAPESVVAGKDDQLDDATNYLLQQLADGNRKGDLPNVVPEFAFRSAERVVSQRMRLFWMFP